MGTNDQRATGTDVIVEIHQSLDAERLAPLWDAPAGAFVSTFFQQRLFLKAFYDHLPRNCAPLVVSVTDRETGRLAMVLPLIRRKSGPMRYIEAPDQGLADYVAPAVAAWFEPDAAQMEQVFQQILAALPKADVLTLKKIPAALPDGRVNPLTLLSGTIPMGTGTKSITLLDVESKDHYLRSGIYKDSMRQLRKLRKTGDVEFRMAGTSEEASALFDHFLGHRLPRFEALDRFDPLAAPRVQAFYRDVAMEGVPSGDVLFSGLYLDGRCIGVDLGLINGDTYLRILTAMEGGELGRYSPGTIAFMLVLDETRARGIRRFDLGVGELGYKNRLSGPIMPIYERHDALSARGQVAVLEAWGRRLIRYGVGRYPQLRGPAETVRQKLRRLRA